MTTSTAQDETRDDWQTALLLISDDSSEQDRVEDACKLTRFPQQIGEGQQP